MKILLATTNQAKVERFKNILEYADPTIEVKTPNELDIESLEVEETAETLAENAELKVRAYEGLVDIPILANDTGFYVDGEGFIDAPKRKALGNVDASSLTKEEISKRMLNFWKDIAKKYGGEVDAAWVEAFIVLYPDGSVKRSESRREVLLTDKEFGTPHLHMPVRALYYSKVTNKPSIQHTKEEEILELKPVVNALRSVLEENG